MLNFRKAREAFGELRSLIGVAKNDPIHWDIALGLEAMVVELDARLSAIEQKQDAILREIRRQK